MRIVIGALCWFVTCFARAACCGPCAFIASVTVPTETTLRSIAVTFLLLAATWNEAILAWYRHVYLQGERLTWQTALFLGDGYKTARCYGESGKHVTLALNCIKETMY